MLKQILLVILAVLWIVLGAYGHRTIKKAYKKYQKYKKIENIDPKFAGIVRDDFKQWNKLKIAIGCYTILPIKTFVFLSILPLTYFLCFLAIITNQNPIFCKLYFLYNVTYGRFVAFVMSFTKLQFDSLKIKTPIVISNHVNWFDILVIAFIFAPMSFLAKKQVQKFPIFGYVGKVIKVVYLSRDNQQARNEVKAVIKKRIQDFNSNKIGAYPLLIFPQGTTSNNKGLLTFKSGAFENMSPITALCLKYQCKNFSMGMDQITQIEHVFLMLSQLTTLTIKKIQFEPNIGQTVQQYQQRCRQKMSEVLGIPRTQGGFRDKMTLKQIRREKQL